MPARTDYTWPMRATFSSDAGIFALTATLAEYGLSTDPGGANDGDAVAFPRYQALSDLRDRLEQDVEIELTEDEFSALQSATQELAFSTEPGGANEGNFETEEQVKPLERLLSGLEQAPPLTPFEPEPRTRISELDERSQAAPEL